MQFAKFKKFNQSHLDKSLLNMYYHVTRPITVYTAVNVIKSMCFAVPPNSQKIF